jgi:hypothetical protein
VKPIDESAMRRICGGIWPGGYGYVISRILKSEHYRRKEQGIRPPMPIANVDSTVSLEPIGDVAPTQQRTE